MAFTGLPPVPTTGITPETFQMFAAVKQNLEELTGQGTSNFAAVTRGSLNVSLVGQLQTSPLAITGRGYSVNGGSVPDLNDFIEVANTVQTLVADVQSIRDRLDLLIKQLGAST